MAPTIVGTNTLTQAEDAVVALVSNLAGFQTFANAIGDASLAASRIYVHDVPQTTRPDKDDWSEVEWSDLFPCCIVREPDEGSIVNAVQYARDMPIRFNCNLSFACTFEAYPPVGMDTQNQARWFLNHIGTIVDDLVESTNITPGEFAATGIRQAESFYRRPYAEIEHLGDVMGFTIQLDREVT